MDKIDPIDKMDNNPRRDAIYRVSLSNNQNPINQNPINQNPINHNPINHNPINHNFHPERVDNISPMATPWEY